MIWYLRPNRRLNRRGFTFIELILTLTLLSFFSVASISYMNGSINESNFKKTILKLEQIHSGLVGNRQGASLKKKLNFGYLGDLGGLPTSAEGLEALISKPASQALWAPNVSVRFGMGWDGPYISNVEEDSFSLKDGWGNSLAYDPISNPPTIRSLGADGALGGAGYDQDITYQISQHHLMADVYGFILDDGAPWSGMAEVEINYPNGEGVLQQTSINVIPADNGYFKFSNIPFGQRSAIIYVPSKAVPVMTIGPFVFTVDKNNFIIPVELTDVSVNKIFRKKSQFWAFND